MSANNLLKQQLNRALAQHQQGDVKSAEKGYLEVLKQEPKNTDAMHLLAILYGQQHFFDKALPYIEKAIELEPNSATYHNSMGNIQKHLNNTQTAIEHYQKALSIEPDSISAHNNLASIYLSQKEYDKATEHYLAALKIDPNFLDTNYNLAITYQKQLQLEKAKQHFNSVLKSDPNHFQSLAYLGSIALQEEKYHNAIDYLKKSLKQFPNNVEAQVNLGAALVKLGKFEEAQKHLKKAIKLEPQHFEAHYNLGCTYLNMHDPKTALTHFLQILSAEPNPDVYYNIGVIYMYQDRHSEAINYLQEAIKYKPDYLDAIINLGVTFLKMEHYDKAIEYFEKALKLDPNNVEVKYILSALQGDQLPQKAPEKYVKHLFDQYAPHYEKHLLEFLHYEAHKKMLTTVKDTLGDELHDLFIVDLGCGTGLTGELFKPYSKKLIGIDLSVKMIEIAGKKNIYDDLHIADIQVTLKSVRNADLILAGDVISYLGDLNETFANVHAALGDRKYFAFSIELMDDSENDFQLQTTARFKHSKKYISALSKQHGFKLLTEQKVELRQQKNQPVSGIIYVLQKDTQ